MRKFAFLLVCWTCSVQGWQEKSSTAARSLHRSPCLHIQNRLKSAAISGTPPSSGRSSTAGRIGQLRHLALYLLVLNPPAAFNIFCSGMVSTSTSACLSFCHGQSKILGRRIPLSCGVPLMSTSGDQSNAERDSSADVQIQSSWEPVLLSSGNSKKLWVGPAVSGTKAPPEGAVTIYLEDDEEVFLTTVANVLHWTTLEALRFLMESDLTGRVVLDYGCGSGVLTLAASALGATSATGIDICESSLARAAENAELNRCERQPFQEVTFVRAGDLEASMADVVVANMLPGPLLSVVLDVARCVRAGGEVFLTGFRPDSEAVIRAAFSPYFSLELRAQGSDGWMALVGSRNSAPVVNDALSAAALG